MANLSAILAQAQAFTDNEKYEEAYNVLKMAYEKNSDDAELLEKLALAAQTLEHKEEAVTYWEKLTEADPTSIVAYSELQDFYYSTNRYKYYMTRAKIKTLNNQVLQAIPDYKKAYDNTQEKDEKTEAGILMAKAYEYTEKYINAIDEYNKLMAISPDVAYNLKVADLYVAMNDKYSAISSLEQSIETYPNNENLKNFLARLYVETDEPDKAEKYATDDLLKIKIRLLKGRNDEAFELLNSLSDKENAEYYKLIAEYYYNKSEWDKCLEAINGFAKYAPNHPLIYQMKSLVCGQKNQKHDMYAYRAKMYLAKNQPDVAMHEYLQAHYTDSSNIQTIEEIIKICESSGERNTAAEFYEKLYRLSPKNENVLVKLGDFYADMGEYQSASEYYDKACEITNSPDVYLKTAKCYEKLKREKIAKDYYEKFVAKAPLNNPELAIAKEKLSKLSDKDNDGDEGFLEKILGFFSKKR